MTDFRVWIFVGGILAAMVALIYCAVYAAGRLMLWADKRDAEAAKRALAEEGWPEDFDLAPIPPRIASRFDDQHRWSRR